MSTDEFFASLLERGFQLWRDGDQIRFKAPKGALTPALRTQFAAEKPALLARMQPGVKYACASYAQERLWFLDRLAEGKAIYNMSEGVFRIRGPIDPARLEAALAAVYTRHEALRTVFTEVAGRPVQVIELNRKLDFRQVDVSDLPADVREARLRAQASDEIKQPFDLAQGPLFRAVLYHIAEDDHLLVLPMHHILFDGWSFGVLIEELSAAYIANDGGASLPPLPLQYADFAFQQRQWLAAGPMERDLTFWREGLGGELPALELPTDRPRPAVPAFEGGKESLVLGAELTRDLNALARDQGATLFMTLLAAYKTLLYRYTYQEDLIVGSPIAGRTLPHADTLLGFFVNSLALRSAPRGDLPFAEFLRQIRETTLAAYAHQDVPLEKLVEVLQPDRDLSGSPLFRTMFVLENAPMPALSFAEGKLEPESLDTAAAKFDITMAVFELDGVLQATVEYDRELFDTETIRRFLSHYRALLAAVVTAPEQPLAHLPMLSAEEQRAVLEDFNQTATELPGAPLVHEAIADCAQQTPDAPAVTMGAETLHFGTLNRRANELAHRLVADGIAPGDTVALCLERGPDLVVAELAILKTGAAYLPLDPAYPRTRLAFMLEDAGARCVLTQGTFADHLPQDGVPIVFLDDGATANHPDTDPAVPVGLDDTAYIIYTSGSTGTPKGVVVAHRSLLNLVGWHRHTFQLSPADRTTLLAGPAFDASVWEIWPTLTAGASLHIPSDATRASAEGLRDWLITQAITVAFAPTPLAETLLACAWPAAAPLRLLLTGGDKLNAAPPAGLPFELINNYGPTENTVVSTSGPVPAAERAGIPDIGRPIANTQVYLLDPFGGPVPIGVAGELYAGGASLARGYLNRPELTAERFVEIDLPGIGRHRLYRTGDLARWLPDGRIAFLGRLDHQVKVRGYRIELGEIEAALTAHPAITEAVVLAREDTPGDKRLVGYVVQDRDYQASASDAEQQDTHVSQWQSLYDSTYAQETDAEDPTLNIIGWNSSYTGTPIPPPEMHEWVHKTVDRILSLKPKRVLEIGCGTGMLLFRVAPHCEHYRAWDFSEVALASIQRTLDARDEAAGVLLEQREATHFEGIPADSLTTVVMNSVIQYFPTVDYLYDVIAHAIEAVAPGGRIFVGDVRSLPLLEAYAASVVFHQADDNVTCETLRERVRQRVNQEEEFVVDPFFFRALKTRLPKVCRVEILPKWGTAENELTRFRYDAILHIGEETPVPVPAAWQRWDADIRSLEELAAALKACTDDTFGLRGLPLARLNTEAQLLHWLKDGDDQETAGALRRRLKAGGVTLDALEALAKTAGWSLKLDWSRQAEDGHVDALFHRGSEDWACDVTPLPETLPPMRTLANNPLQGDFLRRLAPVLRAHLLDRLPDYMVPSAFLALSALPLTPNGKLDRAALPAPERSRDDLAARYVAPRTPMESELAGIWERLLRVEQVGVEDSFFDLGGHSLLATQLLSRIRDAFGAQLSLGDLFAQPTIAHLAAVIEGHGDATVAEAPMRPVDLDQPQPLSFSQQRIWFLEQMESGTSAYNMPAALRLRGTLNTDALAQSLTEIVRRHASLRTTFGAQDGEAVQYIAPPAPVPLPVIGLENDPAPEAAMRAQIDAETVRPFDLSTGPLFRATLLRMAPEDHVLLLNMHHIVSDGWSVSVLMRELTALYAAFAEGHPAPLAEPEHQYADFAVWQRERLQGAVLQEQEQYWLNRLGSDLPALDLPTDYARPATQSSSGALRPFRVSPATTEALRRLSQDEGVTLFMTLLAGFKALLHRWCGQDDIVVGSPIAGRTRGELEALVGFFLNTLVLRTPVSGEGSFRDLVGAVRDTCLGAYAHQEVPFERLVELLDPERDPSRMPLFQVMFVFENMPKVDLALAGLSIESLPLNPTTAKIDLNVHLEERDGGLSGFFQYDTDLFSEATIDWLMTLFDRLLGHVGRQPDTPLDALRLLHEDEQVLRPDTTALLPPPPEYIPFPDAAERDTLHGRFENIAALHSDRPAYIRDEVHYSYSQLNAHANRIAHTLLAEDGTEPGRVGLFLRKGPAMLAAMLGALKAGKTYVPIDPEYPAERIAFMAADAGFGLCLAADDTAVAAREALGTAIQILDCTGPALADEESNPGHTVPPDTVAYLLYTSGSTGQPKGVMQSHRNALHHAAAYTNNLRIACTDRLTLIPSYSFDAAVMDIYGALLNGACLYGLDLLDDGPEGVNARVQRDQLTLFHATPTVFRACMQALAPGELLASVRSVVLGGEESVRTDWEAFRDHFAPGSAFINGLGPTESTLTLQYCLGHEHGPALATVPVGYPVADTAVRLLNTRGNDAELLGEIAIESPYVALGYWNLPSETAQAFAQGDDNLRRYRTGDLGRRLANGAIAFIGRRDLQLKIRGYRIEPGEIENQLAACPEVQDAVVIARDDESGDPMLVAYVVRHDADADADWSAIRARLAAALPAQMMPAAFVAIPKIPLSPNGKLDRRALPAPDRSAVSTKEFVAPRDATEEAIAAIWCELLGLERVGVHDNFFELGGHSLLGTRVMSRLRDALDVEIPLRRLFDAPTVAGLADQARHRHEGSEPPDAPVLRPVPRTGGVPLSFSQQRLWFLDQLEPGSTVYNMPGALRLEGALNVPALEAAVSEVVRRHESLRTAFDEEDGEPVQIITPPAPVQLLVEPVASQAALEAAMAAEADTAFDLRVAPLFRVRLLRLAQDEHVLLLTMHHIVSDGWSVGLLMRELTTLYAAFVDDKPSPLGDLPIQYADYAAWQREWLQGEALTRQLDYWRGQLGEAPEPMTLPYDAPRPRTQRYCGAVHRFRLSPALRHRLEALGQQQGTTLFMTTLAAFKALLHRWSGEAAVTVGTPIANRTRAEVEELIGFFLNTLVLRTPVEDAEPFSALLQRVREGALGAFAHQDVPFEKLVEALHPVRDLSRMPLFQVMFVFQNMPRAHLELPGIRMEMLEPVLTTTKLDLNVHLREDGEGLEGLFQYSTDLFRPETMIWLAECFETILESIVADPETPVAALHALPGGPKLGPPAMRPVAIAAPTLHGAFEAVVDRHGDRTALTDARGTWSYSELNHAANAIADALLAVECKANLPVGLLLPRGRKMIAAMLGALKAGVPYIPLDPALPEARIQAIRADAGIDCVVVDTATRAHAQALGIPRIVDCTAFDGTGDTKNPNLPLAGDHLAYVLYTSGSTGTPKGVTQAHQGVLHYIDVYTKQLAITSADRLGLAASMSFDAAVVDIYTALLNGAQLEVLDVQQDGPEVLTRAIETDAVTIVHVTPTLFRAWDESLPESWKTGAVRAVVLGGEPVGPWDTAVHTRRFGADAVLLNLYGQTESTISSMATLEHGHDTFRCAPIGAGVDRTELLLLDETGAVTELLGEIAVRSAYVTPGYWHDAELTEAAFVAERAAGDARCYRTGDIGRRRPDGSIEFVGRKDDQVKLRGFRIALGEVEAQLRAHPAIREAAAMVREDRPRDFRLVAYAVADAPDGADAAALREWLRARLPEYMLPATFVLLDAIPKTTSGKVDRRALPVPDTRRDATREWIAPRNPTESAVAALFERILSVDRAGVEDNFFDLGGHSLLATQLMSRVRDTLGVAVPLRAFFEAPTVAALAALVDRGETDTRPPLVPVARDAALPLSFAQQRLWFLEQLSPGSTAYVIPAALRLEGTLDPALLRRAIETIQHRHESLRTQFNATDGQPIQQILPPAPFDLPVESLEDLPETQRETVLAQRLHAFHSMPFDLEKGPLLRAALYRLNDRDHCLAVSMHHIVSDGWSMGVFGRELAALYGAYAEGAASPLPPLPVQYADYAAWQRAWLDGETRTQQLAYWETTLHGLSVLELPADLPRPAVQQFDGAAVYSTLPRGTQDALASLGRATGATPFMTLLAAFTAVLHRYTGQDDIAVGSPIANRTLGDIENLIGFFVNTLVLRTALGGNPTFRTLIENIRRTALDAYAHQDVPFEQIVSAVNPVRDTSRNPLVQVAFAMQNLPKVDATLPGLRMRRQETGAQSTRHDLELHIRETEQGLESVVFYRTDLFLPETIQQFVGHWETMVAALLDDPDQRVDEVPLLSAQERQTLLQDWNATARAYPDDTGVHTLFEAHAARTPDAPALIVDGATLSYGALNAEANRIAHALRARGVEPGDFVAMFVDRSVEAVAGMLGVLKAGAAYVPLDTAYPPDRIAFMLADSGAKVLLTRAALRGDLPPTDAVVLSLDGEDIPRGGNTDNLALPVQGGDRAYIIYTSGSTGKPKGVVVPHRAIARLVINTDYVHLDPADCIAHMSNVSFDAATFEIWGALCNGARLLLLPREVVLSPPKLAEAFRDQAVTTAFVTTALFNQIAAQLPEAFAPLREVLFGGEAVSPGAVARVLAARPPARLLHVYGPTENTTFSTWAEITAVPAGAATLPIGRPIANSTCYVLDPRGEAVPVGVAGELYVGGAGLALEYHQRPELTAERFVTGQFGERLYRTGDLVRWRHDGQIEFLDRLDQQVKVRGFRIELGEVEHRLEQHPELRHAVAMAREDRPGDKRLVAYIVATNDSPPPETALREFLRADLPAYMVPDFFVPLDALPLTPNGKIDRKALPVPGPQRRDTETLEAPRTPTETAVADLWKQVLRVEQAGIHENFFESGGNSLLLVELVAHLCTRFEMDVPLQDVFQQPSIAAIAERVDRLQRGEALPEAHPERSPLVVPLREGAGRTPLFCIAPAGGTVYPYYAMTHALGTDYPVYALMDPSFKMGVEPCGTIEEMARYYIDALRTVQPVGPYCLAGWSFGALVVYEMSRQLKAAGETVALTGMIEFRIPDEQETTGWQRRFQKLMTLFHSAAHLGSTLKNMLDGFLVSVAFLENTVKKSVVLDTMQRKLGGFGVGFAWRFLLKRANLAEVMTKESQLMLIKHPSTKHFVRISAANLKAMNSYEMKSYDGDITLYRADHQPSRGHNARVAEEWKAYVSGQVESVVLPGDHFSIMRNPQVQALADDLRARLDALPQAAVTEPEHTRDD